MTTVKVYTEQYGQALEECRFLRHWLCYTQQTNVQRIRCRSIADSIGTVGRGRRYIYSWCSLCFAGDALRRFTGDALLARLETPCFQPRQTWPAEIATGTQDIHKRLLF